MKFAYLFFFLIPSFAGAANVAPKPLETAGLTVYAREYRGGDLSLSLDYYGSLAGGALVGPCRPDHVADSDLTLRVRIDGGEFREAKLYRECGAGPFRDHFGANFPGYPPFGAHEVEFYIQDSRGGFDSDYGRNFRFRYER